MADDDDKWLAGLRSGVSGASSEQRTLQALHDAIRGSNEQTDVRHDGPRELGQLLFRLRRERLLGASSAAPWRRALPLSAAALLVVAVAITWTWPAMFGSGDHDVPVIRGDAPQIIDVDDADKAAEQLMARLRSLGIVAQRYDVGAIVGVTATVPKASAGAVRSALEPLGAVLPASGELRLEMRGKRPR